MAETMTLSQAVAEEIRVMLARRRMSGRQLAAKLDVSQTWISTRLNGTTPIDLNDLERIADALDADVTELLPMSHQREGRTVVVSGSRAGQTTVSYPPVTEQPRPSGHPERMIPPASTRRPARLVHA